MPRHHTHQIFIYASCYSISHVLHSLISAALEFAHERKPPHGPKPANLLPRKPESNLTPKSSNAVFLADCLRFPD
jgi:hypothetical protein